MFIYDLFHQAGGADMKITFCGHACIMVEAEKKILIDPFLTGNPQAAISADMVDADYILLTHAHSDHLGDTVEIAKRTNAKVVAVVELADWLMQQGVDVHPMNLGGEMEFYTGFKVKLTQAWHSSALPDGTACGVPCGFLFWLEGKCVYFAGDTALFSDMREVIAPHKLDLAILPIGGNWTMGPSDALIAADWLAAKYVLPIHYNTFSLIDQDVEAYKVAVEQKTNSKCVVLQPGESMEL